MVHPGINTLPDRALTTQVIADTMLPNPNRQIADEERYSTPRADIFLDENAARKHLEALRWPEGPVCPFCLTGGVSRALGGKSEAKGLYYCLPCRKKFTVRVGTALERSHIPLTKWLLATHLIANAKSGLSAGALRNALGVHYRSAQQMTVSIRQATAE